MKDKSDRILILFYKILKGEELSIKKLANEFDISTKSISRDVALLHQFLADHRDLVGNIKLQYSNRDKVYRISRDYSISAKEITAVSKCLIGARPFSYNDMITILSKFKELLSEKEQQELSDELRAELNTYEEVHIDCEDLPQLIYDLSRNISDQRKITIQYYKMDRTIITRKLLPMSILFNEFYYYLIATDEQDLSKIKYFRVDRIRKVIAHRELFTTERLPKFDIGEFRKRNLFMWPGKKRRVVFEFTGPSYQAILDRIPSAKIVELHQNTVLIEAEVMGEGIIGVLLSQGSWVKVLSPESLKDQMKNEIEKMKGYY